MIKHGQEPYLECSSAGDMRFSAFFASVDGQSIESLYQGFKVFNGRSGLSWREAKGKKADNQEEANLYYSRLWDSYIERNPHLQEVLLGAKGLSDQFGQKGHVCQATELWRIRNRINIARMFSFVPDSKKNWTEDFPAENGCYANICIHCKEMFYGHKRRAICKDCVKA
jgi:hypothetical protein